MNWENAQFFKSSYSNELLPYPWSNVTFIPARETFSSSAYSMTSGSHSIRRPFRHSATLTGVAPLQLSQFRSGRPDRYRPTRPDGTITCIPRLGNVSLSMSTA